MKLSFRLVETSQGWCSFVATRRGLRAVNLPARTAAAARREVRRCHPEAVEASRMMPKLSARLRDFFAGRCVVFDVAFDWAEGTDFEQDVWHACHRIGYGRTASYKHLAERVGRPGAARAVGTAMKRNPCPIVVPCHRVVKSDGSIGGFSGTGGVALKRRLLEMEMAVDA